MTGHFLHKVSGLFVFRCGSSEWCEGLRGSGRLKVRQGAFLKVSCGQTRKVTRRCFAGRLILGRLQQFATTFGLNWHDDSVSTHLSGDVSPSGGESWPAAVDALEKLREALAQLELPLDIAGAQAAREDCQAARAQLDDYILPRYRSLDAPLLAVVGGSTGAGKSTLVNALAGHPVTRAGAIRPTTRQPILLHNPGETSWFVGDRILPTLSRIHGELATAGTAAIHAGAAPDASAMSSLVLVGDPAIPAGIALLDAPDVDSISDANRALAAQLLAAADLWIFVTTANRYADAVPWRLLLDAARRDITVAVVLDRVPPGAETEIGADLASMLQREGLGRAELFVVPEAPLDELGMLPASATEPLLGWLLGIAADAEARKAIAKRTLSGAVRSLAEKVTVLSDFQDRQDDAVRQLSADVAAAYSDAAKKIALASGDGSLLRGEVLARWQDFVGTGEVFRALESGVGRLRDRIGAFFKGQPPPAVKVETAIETGLQAVIVDQGAKAGEAAQQRWLADPAGRALLEGLDLGGATADFPQEVAAEIRAWQGYVLELIRSEGAAKRSQARWLSLGVNGLGVALMVSVFTVTGGLTGAEIGIAGGTAVVGQKLLEAVFGEDAVRRLTQAARADLEKRCAAMLERQEARFVDLLPGALGENSQLKSLANRLAVLGEAG